MSAVSTTCFQIIRGSISVIERNDEEVRVEWKLVIPNIFCQLVTDCYDSPDFDFNSARWYLRAWKTPFQHVNLSLIRQNEGPPMTIHFVLSFAGVGKLEVRDEGEFTFSEGDWIKCCSDFLPRSVLREHRSILIPHDVLTVRCIMKNIFPSPANGVSLYKDNLSQRDGVFEESRTCTCESKSLNKQGCEKLHEDFAKLLASGEDSDVTVCVGDVEFKVHRAILSARSPVLSAMFRHETEEKATNRISVCDCEPEVFKQYLHFIYSGNVELPSEQTQTVFGIYRIADKYLADNLKQHCLEHIKNTLSVQTFCEAMKLALTHGESELLQLAIEFATKNLPLIICTIEWQNFLRDHPTETNEILIKCICPQTEK